MAVPTSRTDLDPAAGNNPPGGSEAVFPNLDNYLRAGFSFIRQNYDDTQALSTALTTRVPAGIIVMWSGSSASIPSGWVLCDGSNGTPDLRNRFVVGATSTYAVGATGGATSTSATTGTGGSHDHGAATGSHVLTQSEIPSHTHGGVPQLTVDTDRGEGHSSLFSVDDTGSTSATGGGLGHTHTIASDSGHTHSVTVATLPPYYALCFIQKT